MVSACSVIAPLLSSVFCRQDQQSPEHALSFPLKVVVHCEFKYLKENVPGSS